MQTYLATFLGLDYGGVLLDGVGGSYHFHWMGYLLCLPITSGFGV